MLFRFSILPDADVFWLCSLTLTGGCGGWWQRSFLVKDDVLMFLDLLHLDI